MPLSIAYKYITEIHRVSLPATLELRDEDGSLLRHRSGRYDNLGRMEALVVHYGSETSTSTISWNDDGTLASITDPLGARISYGYDDSGLYVIRVDSESLGWGSDKLIHGMEQGRGTLKEPHRSEWAEGAACL